MFFFNFFIFSKMQKNCQIQKDIFAGARFSLQRFHKTGDQSIVYLF